MTTATKVAVPHTKRATARSLFGRSRWSLESIERSPVTSRRQVAVCLVSAILSVITLAHPARAIAAPIDFDQQVKPVLEKHCLECHGPAKQESSFRIDVRRMFLEGGDLGEPLVVPGNSSKSPLLAIVSGRGDLKMPPEGDPLGAADVEILKRWIDDGLKMPAGSEEVREALKTDHWSFQPLASVAAPVDPDAQTRTWTANPIDAFVRRRQREMGLIASPVAEPEVLIRRLFLVMHGLAPTRSQVAEFARDPSAAAYDRLVDHVLASPRYGERWARHWLDVVRFGETHGFETNRERPNAYHYRDYVIAAFNDDRPYDEFVREQIAGDAFGRDVATGFLVAGPYDLVKSPDINLTLMQRQDELADMVNTTGVTFLGLTLGCARCHHHKFDPITQSDYYALQAVYAGVEHGDRAMSLGSQRAASVARTRRRIDDLRRRLQAFIPAAQQHEFVIVDDKQLVVGGRRGVRHLLPKAGEGVNPPGSERGFRDDRGGSDRIANLSGGGYSWWKVKPG
ncbi:MAG: DUF1549 domain-containing protein, partial [Pirellulaceae bacterium]|nr:DUF1549 domain-containing protein [Pirellulaceae bacterium]